MCLRRPALPPTSSYNGTHSLTVTILLSLPSLFPVWMGGLQVAEGRESLLLQFCRVVVVHHDGKNIY